MSFCSVRRRLLLSGAALVGALMVSGGFSDAQAQQDATWRADPVSGDFNTDANWDNPATVPTGTAFFGDSDENSLTFSQDTTIGGWTFNADADAYVFNVENNQILVFEGTGIAVNGGSVTINASGSGTIEFRNESTAGGATTAASIMQFRDSSSAGNAILNNFTTEFRDNSTAGNATINKDGNLTFFDNSNAGSATINHSNGFMTFTGESDARDATITNDASLVFNNMSNAGTAEIINNATGFDALQFNGFSTAENTEITNNGRLIFSGDSSAGSATINNEQRRAPCLSKATSTAGNAAIDHQCGGNETFFLNSSDAGRR